MKKLVWKHVNSDEVCDKVTRRSGQYCCVEHDELVEIAYGTVTAEHLVDIESVVTSDAMDRYARHTVTEEEDDQRIRTEQSNRAVRNGDAELCEVGWYCGGGHALPSKMHAGQPVNAGAGADIVLMHTEPCDDAVPVYTLVKADQPEIERVRSYLDKQVVIKFADPRLDSIEAVLDKVIMARLGSSEIHSLHVTNRRGQDVFVRWVDVASIALAPDRPGVDWMVTMGMVNKPVTITTPTEVYTGVLQEIRNGWVGVRASDDLQVAIPREDISSIEPVL